MIIEILLQLNQIDRTTYQILDRKMVKLHNDFDHHQQKHLQMRKLLLIKRNQSLSSNSTNSSQEKRVPDDHEN